VCALLFKVFEVLVTVAGGIGAAAVARADFVGAGDNVVDSALLCSVKN
jgi:hypothetical protein